MKLTVVIPCRDDARVAACARSVDADAEIVIGLNGSPPGFREHVTAALGGRVRLEILARPNLSRALEHGIRAASWDRVLLMDSDCLFAPGSLAAVEAAFAQGAPADEVYKGQIVFGAGGAWGSELVARSRSQRMAGRLSAYKPPLALSRELVAKLGGYFFDPRLPWKEDADLDCRVRQASVRIVPVDGCLIHHAPLSIAGDLRSTFRYGMGAAIAHHLSIPLTPPARSIGGSLRRHGTDAALYMAFANQVRTAGLCLRADPAPAVGRALAHGADRGMMGTDLEILLGQLEIAAVSVEPLPRLEVPANRTQAFRVRLANGQTLKAAEVWSGARAETIERALAWLERRPVGQPSQTQRGAVAGRRDEGAGSNPRPRSNAPAVARSKSGDRAPLVGALTIDAFPKVRGRRGRALLFHWLAGEPVSGSDDRVVDAAGELHGRVHGHPAPDLRAESRLEPAAAARQLVANLRRLCEADLVEGRAADRLASWAFDRAPDDLAEPAVFVHTDLCPENLLLADAKLRVIDHGSWAVGPAAFDLARLWWRWPMRSEARAAWLAAYQRGLGHEIDLASLPFLPEHRPRAGRRGGLPARRRARLARRREHPAGSPRRPRRRRRRCALRRGRSLILGLELDGVSFALAAEERSRTSTGCSNFMAPNRSPFPPRPTLASRSSSIPAAAADRPARPRPPWPRAPRGSPFKPATARWRAGPAATRSWPSIPSWPCCTACAGGSSRSSAARPARHGWRRCA